MAFQDASNFPAVQAFCCGGWFGSCSGLGGHIWIALICILGGNCLMRSPTGAIISGGETMFFLDFRDPCPARAAAAGFEKGNDRKAEPTHAVRGFFHVQRDWVA